MESKLRSKFKVEMVKALLKRFNEEIDQVQLVGNHQSFVYKVGAKNKRRFIRIIINKHRTYDEISAELAIIQYLAENGFDVAIPTLSENNRYIESIEWNGDIFHAVAFNEAIGFGVGQYPWTPQVPYRVGEMTGKFHGLMKKYSDTNAIRHKWDENTFIAHADKYLSAKNEKVLIQLDNLVKEIKKLDRTPDNYGLIHGDIVACNYRMTDKSITLFDFDEASYCWYLNDVAISTFYSSLTWQGYIDKEGSKISFIKFMEGYLKYNHIQKELIQKLPLFLKLREIILYVAIHRSQDLSNLDQWTYNFMAGRKERIEQNIPFIDIDFHNL